VILEVRWKQLDKNKKIERSVPRWRGFGATWYVIDLAIFIELLYRDLTLIDDLKKFNRLETCRSDALILARLSNWQDDIDEKSSSDVHNGNF